MSDGRCITNERLDFIRHSNFHPTFHPTFHFQVGSVCVDLYGLNQCVLNNFVALSFYCNFVLSVKLKKSLLNHVGFVDSWVSRVRGFLGNVDSWVILPRGSVGWFCGFVGPNFFHVSSWVKLARGFVSPIFSRGLKQLVGSWVSSWVSSWV